MNNITSLLEELKTNTEKLKFIADDEMDSSKGQVIKQFTRKIIELTEYCYKNIGNNAIEKMDSFIREQVSQIINASSYDAKTKKLNELSDVINNYSNGIVETDEDKSLSSDEKVSGIKRNHYRYLDESDDVKNKDCQFGYMQDDILEMFYKKYPFVKAINNERDYEFNRGLKKIVNRLEERLNETYLEGIGKAVVSSNTMVEEISRELTKSLEEDYTIKS